jgi:hypothetical protein
MSERTHKWLVGCVDEVQTRAFTEYTAALQKAGSDEKVIGTAGDTLYTCVQDPNAMMAHADYILAVPMVGFTGYTPSNTASDLSLPVRQDIYFKIGNTKSWKHQTHILQAEAAEVDRKPKMYYTSLTSYETALHQLSPYFATMNSGTIMRAGKTALRYAKRFAASRKPYLKSTASPY